MATSTKATKTATTKATAKAAATTTSRPYSDKTREQEPRGRPANGQPLLSGATADDPLISVQILKVRQSVWKELAEAAAERTWHRSVLVRKVLDEWMERRKLAKGKQGKAGRQEKAVGEKEAA